MRNIKIKKLFLLLVFSLILTVTGMYGLQKDTSAAGADTKREITVKVVNEKPDGSPEYADKLRVGYELEIFKEGDSSSIATKEVGWKEENSQMQYIDSVKFEIPNGSGKYYIKQTFSNVKDPTNLNWDIKEKNYVGTSDKVKLVNKFKVGGNTLSLNFTKELENEYMKG